MERILMFFPALLVLTGAAVLLAHRENNRLLVSEYEIQIPGLPAAFDGFTIAHISDLHDKRFGADQCGLVSAILAHQPDLAAITGDFVSSKHALPDNSITLVERLAAHTPVYFVTGNHEYRHEGYAHIEERLQTAGATPLRGSTTFCRESDQIALLGIDDPAFFGIRRDMQISQFTKALHRMAKDAGDAAVTVLLSHRPEVARLYERERIDVVLSGHAHGGVWRIPKLGGVFGPNRTFFPKYDAGHFKIGDTNLIVSCGLGSTSIPFRIANPPNLVVVRLRKARSLIQSP
jgi:uncharacterized protein